MRAAEIKEIARRAAAAIGKSTYKTYKTCPVCDGAGDFEGGACLCARAGRVVQRPSYVELTLKDDPKVAASLSAEDIASCRWPLCPGGPMGLLVSADHRSETGTLRVRFCAAQLLKWAAAQGGQG